ncbi:MAG: hypothetical protein APF84_18755 [Gracilibacter sp. BRH_c7a]|nr:MAG: hypothetical protein APF84_18755 [Gracilibacter sp. BRH_c7a]
MGQSIMRFLDEDGKLKQFPAKQQKRLLAYAYLAKKFEFDIEYSEQEVNAIIGSWHTFGDYFVLRRGLVESCYLCRLPNGSKYWRNKAKKGDSEQ